jgi:glutamine amidotransferase-like uncharacterized protein
MVAALKKSFNATISHITAQNILDGALRQDGPILFVVPGIFGENCQYHSDFTLALMEELHRFLEKGGVSVHSCAGAYAVSRRCDYVTPWGTIRHQMSMKPIFNGRAFGPLWPYAVQPQPASKGSELAELADTYIAPVKFKNANGGWEEACISYGNGPGLMPDDPNDPSIEILAIYHQMKSQPPAMIRQSIGRGAAYLLGNHPEFLPIEIDAVGHQSFPALRALSKALELHEPGRKKFMDTQMNRFAKDLGYMS